MISFQPVTLKDEAIIRRHLSLSPSKQIIDCFEAIYLWRDVLQVEWAQSDGFMVVKVHYDSGVPQFLFPFGQDNPESVFEKLKNYCLAKGYPFRLAKVRKEQLLFLQELFPGQITTAAHRDHAEYIFSADTFRNYTGKDLQPKRNFVNYARSHYQWQYEPITPAIVEECRTFASQFAGDDSFQGDTEALLNALSDFEYLNMQGGVIRIQSAVSALFICTLLGDGQTAAGLFLRGDHSKKGIIPLLYQEYFRAHPQFDYFNFGEDLGVEGLRKNKLSFKPLEIMDLYEVNLL